LTDELRAISPCLLKGTVTQTVRFESPPNTVISQAFQYNGQTLCLAVNPLPLRVEARLITTNHPAGEAQGFGPYEVKLRVQ
jgi:hypothetical protein